MSKMIIQYRGTCEASLFMGDYHLDRVHIYIFHQYTENSSLFYINTCIFKCIFRHVEVLGPRGCSELCQLVWYLAVHTMFVDSWIHSLQDYTQCQFQQIWLAQMQFIKNRSQIHANTYFVNYVSMHTQIISTLLSNSRVLFLTKPDCLFQERQHNGMGTIKHSIPYRRTVCRTQQGEGLRHRLC